MRTGIIKASEKKQSYTKLQNISENEKNELCQNSTEKHKTFNPVGYDDDQESPTREEKL